MNIIFRFLSLIILFFTLFSFLLNSYPYLFYRKTYEILILPEAAINIAWYYYEKKSYYEAIKFSSFFNDWQPTEESLLFEAYCLKMQGLLKESEKKIVKVINFNPNYKKAYIAYIDLKIKEIEVKNNISEKTIDSIISKVPWDDKEAIENICFKLLKISKKFNTEEKKLILSSILYLLPSNKFLKEFAIYILKDEKNSLILKRIAANIFISITIFEKYNLSNEEMAFLEKHYLNFSNKKEKDLILNKNFKWFSYEEIKESFLSIENINRFEKYPLCLDKEWIKALGNILRNSNE